MKLFYWGPGETNKNIATVSGCNSGKLMICQTNADVNRYHGKTISYYFEAKDSANTVKSKTANTTIDVINPAITLNMPLANSINTASNVPVRIGLDAAVEKIEMFDNSEKAKKLCNDCNGYEKNVGFKDGRHDVRFVATDFAGNTNEKTTTFYVDTRIPVISSIKPGGYTKGSLELKYTEENIEAVKLYYKKSTEGEYSSATFTSCASGSNKVCSLNLNLAGLNGQRIDYYAVIEDIAGNLASSKVMEGVMVDTSVPVLTVNNPISNSYATTVPLDISINEKVARLEASDNGSFSLLCSGCTGIVKQKSYTKGQHTIIIRVTDYAGNTAEATKSFNVV